MLIAESIFFIVFIAALVPRASAADGSFTVKVRPQVTIKGGSVTLADIADLSGDDRAILEQLARMPLGTVSGTRTLSRSEVFSVIKSKIEGVQETNLTGADSVKIMQAVRAPEAGEIDAAVRDYLAAVTRWNKEEIEVQAVHNLKDIALPEGDVSLRVASRGVPSSFQNLLLSMEAVQDGKVQRTFWIKADARVHAQVVRVTRPVAFRSILQEGDLQLAACDIADPRAEYYRSTAEAVGSIARRALSAGELLSHACIDEASFVRNGETVKLLVQSGGLRMSLMVRALQSGKIGDTVKVRNTDSDRVITAVVTGRGEVRIRN